MAEQTQAERLAEVLVKHDDWRFHSKESWSCYCGEPLNVPEGLVRPVHRAHLAAVVLAHLTAEGWAQGREEFAVRDSEGTWELDPPTRHDAERVARAQNAHLRRAGWAADNSVVRRRVTDWEPVDG